MGIDLQDSDLASFGEGSERRNLDAVVASEQQWCGATRQQCPIGICDSRAIAGQVVGVEGKIAAID
jgi:hypothetical protein